MASDPEGVSKEETEAASADTFEEELLDYDPHEDEDLLAEEMKAYGEEGLADVMSYREGHAGNTEAGAGQEVQDQVTVPTGGDGQSQLKTNATGGSPQCVDADDGVPNPNDWNRRVGGNRQEDGRGCNLGYGSGPHRDGGSTYDQQSIPDRRSEREDDRKRETRYPYDRQQHLDRGESLRDSGRDRSWDRDRDRERNRERDYRECRGRDRDWDREPRRRDWDREKDRDRDQLRGEADRSAAYDQERERPRARPREWELERNYATAVRHSRPVEQGSAQAYDGNPSAQGSGGTATESATARDEQRVRAPYGPPNMRREDPLPHQRGLRGLSPRRRMQELCEAQDREREREGEPGFNRERESDRDRGEEWRPLPQVNDRRIPVSQGMGSGPAREYHRPPSQTARADGGAIELGTAVGRAEGDRPGGNGRPEYDRPGSRSGQVYDRCGGNNKSDYDRPAMDGGEKQLYDRPSSGRRPEYDWHSAEGRSDSNPAIVISKFDYGQGGGGSGSGLEYERVGAADATRARMIRASSAPGLGESLEDRSRSEASLRGPAHLVETISGRGEASPRIRRTMREWDSRGGANDRIRDRGHDRERDREWDHERRCYRDSELRDRDPRDKELWERSRSLHDRDRNREPHDREPRDREVRDRDFRDRELRDREFRDREIRDREFRDREYRDREIQDQDIRERGIDREPRDRERGRSQERWGSTAIGGGQYGPERAGLLGPGASAPRDSGDWRRGSQATSPLSRGAREVTPFTVDVARGAGGVVSAVDDAARRERSPHSDPPGSGAGFLGNGVDTTGRLAWGPGTGSEGATGAGEGNVAASAPRIRAPLFVGSLRPPPDVGRLSAGSRQQQRRCSPEPLATPLQQSPARIPSPQDQQRGTPGTSRDAADADRRPRAEARALGDEPLGSCIGNCSDDDGGGGSSSAKVDLQPQELADVHSGGMDNRWKNAIGDVSAPQGTGMDGPAGDASRPSTKATGNDAGHNEFVLLNSIAGSPSRATSQMRVLGGEADEGAVPSNPTSRPCSRWENCALEIQSTHDVGHSGDILAVHTDGGTKDAETLALEPQGAGSSGPSADQHSTGAGTSERHGIVHPSMGTSVHEAGGVSEANVADANEHGGRGTQKQHVDSGCEGRSSLPHNATGQPGSANQAEDGSGPHARRQPYQECTVERPARGKLDMCNDDKRPRQPPLLVEGRGFDEVPSQQHQQYGSVGEARRDYDDERRRPTPYHSVPPQPQRGISRREPYDGNRLPPRRDPYDDRPPPPPRRKDEPYDDLRPRGLPPPLSQRRHDYDGGLRHPNGPARGYGREDLADRRPHVSHVPVPLVGNTTAGSQRGDPYDSRRPQMPPPGYGSEGLRNRDSVDRSGGSSAVAGAARGYGREPNSASRREGPSDYGRGGCERDREREYRERKREWERDGEGLMAHGLPSEGPSSYYRSSADRRQGSPPPPPKRQRSSPPRAGAGVVYPALEQRQHQQPRVPPGSGSGLGGVAAADAGPRLTSAEIVRVMMAAPGGAPVAGRGGETSAAGPGGDGAGFVGPEPSFGPVTAPAAAAATTNSSQLLTAEQKRKLLWCSKKVESVVSQGAESLYGANRWDRAAGVLESDREKEKFQRLMGLKGDLTHRLPALPIVEARPPSPGSEAHLAMTREQQERVLGDVEQQYLAGLKRKDGRTTGLGM